VSTQHCEYSALCCISPLPSQRCSSQHSELKALCLCHHRTEPRLWEPSTGHPPTLLFLQRRSHFHSSLQLGTPQYTWQTRPYHHSTPLSLNPSLTQPLSHSTPPHSTPLSLNPSLTQPLSHSTPLSLNPSLTQPLSHSTPLSLNPSLTQPLSHSRASHTRPAKGATTEDGSETLSHTWIAPALPHPTPLPRRSLKGPRCTTAGQYGTVQYSTVQYSAVQNSTAQFQRSTVQLGSAQCSTLQHRTAQYQYSPEQDPQACISTNGVRAPPPQDPPLPSPRSCLGADSPLILFLLATSGTPRSPDPLLLRSHQGHGERHQGIPAFSNCQCWPSLSQPLRKTKRGHCSTGVALLRLGA